MNARSFSRAFKLFGALLCFGFATATMTQGCGGGAPSCQELCDLQASCYKGQNCVKECEDQRKAAEKVGCGDENEAALECLGASEENACSSDASDGPCSSEAADLVGCIFTKCFNDNPPPECGLPEGSGNGGG